MNFTVNSLAGKAKLLIWKRVWTILKRLLNCHVHFGQQTTGWFSKTATLFFPEQERYQLLMLVFRNRSVGPSRNGSFGTLINTDEFYYTFSELSARISINHYYLGFSLRGFFDLFFLTGPHKISKIKGVLQR